MKMTSNPSVRKDTQALSVAAENGRLIFRERVMPYRYAPKPDDLLRNAQWRKDRALTWFHKVTSQMSEAQIASECVKRGVATDGKSLHDLQTALLRLDGDNQ